MSDVHTVDILNIKRFTQEHLDITQKYYSTDVWPGYYDNKELAKKFKGLKFICRQLMDIKDIKYDTTEEQLSTVSKAVREQWAGQWNTMQLPRVRPAINRHKLWEKMQENGYELSHKPMVVIKCPDGLYWLNDGRTRLEELLNMNFENLIVDYYECDNLHDFNKFSLANNPTESVRSPQRMEDVIKLGSIEILNGRLKNNRQAIEQFINDVTGGAYLNKRSGNKTKSYGKILASIEKAEDTGFLPIDEKGAYKFLRDNGYHDNVKKGIYYLVCSSESKNSAIFTVSKKIRDFRKEGTYLKELRVVINVEPDITSNPASSWNRGIDSFRKIFAEGLVELSSAFFGGRKADMSIIKVYGAIPVVFSLAQQYPLHELVIFDKTTEETFSQLHTDNALTKAFLDE